MTEDGSFISVYQAGAALHSEWWMREDSSSSSQSKQQQRGNRPPPPLQHCGRSSSFLGFGGIASPSTPTSPLSQSQQQQYFTSPRRGRPADASCEASYHVCPVCLQRIKHKHNLKQHMRDKHSGETKMHRCNVCGNEYKWKISLYRHVAKVHRNQQQNDGGNFQANLDHNQSLQ